MARRMEDSVSGLLMLIGSSKHSGTGALFKRQAVSRPQAPADRQDSNRRGPARPRQLARSPLSGQPAPKKIPPAGNAKDRRSPAEVIPFADDDFKDF
jgi:hypothetical protein